MAGIISIDTLSVTLGDHFQALKDLSVELQSGKIIGLIGPSGAGKTTLIRSIVGRQRITDGNLTVLGLPAGSAALRPRLSYMTQEVSVYSDLTVQQNVRYFAAMAGHHGKRGKAVSAKALAAVHMTDKAGVLTGSLSGGQRQRVSLAIALLGEPELMVLDEPTVGLDPVLREQLWELFRELSGQGTTVIISSHVMDEAERCDDLLLIRGGALVAHGPPRELCRHNGVKTVEEVFLKLAGGRK